MFKVINFIGIFFISFKLQAQQTEFYVGYKNYPNGLMTRVRVLPIDNNRYYTLSFFENTKMDSLQFKRYREPFFSSQTFSLNLKNITSSGSGNYIVVNYMVNDSMAESFAVSCPSQANAPLEVTSWGVLGENLILAGRYNYDTLIISGKQAFHIRKTGPGNAFLLNLKPGGEPVFLKCTNLSFDPVSIIESNQTHLSFYLPYPKNKRPDLQAFNNPVPTSLVNDSMILSVILEIDNSGTTRFFSGSTLSNASFGTNNMKYAIRGSDRFIISITNDYTGTGYNLNNSVIDFNGSRNAIQYPASQEFSMLSFVEINHIKKLHNHFWIRSLKNKPNLTQTQLRSLSYYKNGFFAVLDYHDSIEFGQNTQPWGRLKLSNDLYDASVLFFDTIRKTVTIGKLPKGLVWATAVNDSNVIVQGEYNDPAGEHNLDTRFGESYRIKNGYYLAQYRNFGELIWARNVNLKWYQYDCFVAVKGSQYLYKSMIYRPDMELGFKTLYPLYSQGDNATWITRLNCKPIADFSHTLAGGCVNGFHLGTLGTSFTWDFGDGTQDKVNRYPSHCYKTNGIFKVKLIVKNSCGSDTAEYLIAIANAALKPIVPKKVNIYPNPASRQFQVDIQNQSGIFSYNIYTITGQHLKEGMAQSGEWIAIPSNITQGVFVLSIQTGNGFASRHFLSVEN